jgi:hypothetical protein
MVPLPLFPRFVFFVAECRGNTEWISYVFAYSRDRKITEITKEQKQLLITMLEVYRAVHKQEAEVSHITELIKKNIKPVM